MQALLKTKRVVATQNKNQCGQASLLHCSTKRKKKKKE